MLPEASLHRLKQALSPSAGQRDRVHAMVRQRLEAPRLLQEAYREATPQDPQRSALWQRVHSRIGTPVASSALSALRGLLSPDPMRLLALRAELLARLQLAPVPTSHRAVKWVAAFALVLVVLRGSPFLFLAPHIAAESVVMVVPTKGTVLLSLQGLWQPLTEEVRAHEGIQLKTDNGEATILLHDDGTVRLAPGTTLALHDVSDRPEPALDGPTVTISAGKMWIQGLLPRHLRGLTVATPFGEVLVHAGSVSIDVREESMLVRTWDRTAILSVGGETLNLLSGEKVVVRRELPRVQQIAASEYDEAWVVQNLQRDAVHQREVAQLQQERRAANAGILPNSPFYSVKRVAEQMDVLLTLDPETKVQKKLSLANTRLNEAAALLSVHETGAEVTLLEYKAALLDVVSGSGGDSVTQFLVRQELAENTAELSAALPDDDGYLLKKTVLEASAELPGEVVDQRDVQGILLVDTLDALQDAIASGDVARAEETYKVAEPYLSLLETDDPGIKPEVKKEALSVLSDTAQQLHETEEDMGMQTELGNALSSFLPIESTIAHAPMTEEQVMALIRDIQGRIFLYSQPRSRWNQLQYELKNLHGHPDEGTILRHLFHALPENGLARYVRTAIQEMRERGE